jgi:three-Cys-motif partner protein
LELTHIAAQPDGGLVRPAGLWTKDKLAILSAYDRHFTTACKRAGGGVYADAFCGPGMNRVRDTGEHLWGSGMLAVRADPPFGGIYLMDKDARNVSAMRARIGDDQRVTLRQGDANVDFVPMLEPVLQSRAPMFCVLDPTGIELRWSTVASLGRARTRANRCELLILLSDSMGYMRLLPVEGMPTDRTLHDMTLLFGNGDWRDVHERKQLGEISPTEARIEYAKLYENQLRGLGYSRVLGPRDVREHGDTGRPLYQLIFATESEAGERIMRDIFERMTPQNPNLRLF